jgi:hypothetical protein
MTDLRQYGEQNTALAPHLVVKRHFRINVHRHALVLEIWLYHCAPVTHQASDQLRFRHVSNNRELSISGTSGKLTLTNCFLGNEYHVEQFKISIGRSGSIVWCKTLVSVMAAFSPPAAGQTTLPAALPWP